MDGQYIFQSILILFIFALLQLTNLLGVGIKHIQNNWSLYRCNPLVIPFSGVFGHDPQETFTYCAQNYKEIIKQVSHQIKILCCINSV